MNKFLLIFFLFNFFSQEPLLAKAPKEKISLVEQKTLKSTSDFHFIQNKGQLIDYGGKIRNDVLYVAYGKSISVYFSKQRISYVMTGQKKEDNAAQSNKNELFQQRMDILLEGSNSKVKVYGRKISVQSYNYYYPHCPEGIRNVASYEELVYENIYPFIDLIFYTGNKESEAEIFEYDFIVHPGGDPGCIRMKYGKELNLKQTSYKSLEISTSFGSLQENLPNIYEKYSSERTKKAVKGSYFIENDNTIRYIVSNYNKNVSLVIDPKVCWWPNTYYGGNSFEDARGITSDAAGNVYVVGNASAGFPTTPGVFQENNGSIVGPAIVKFDDCGNRTWATFFGVSGCSSTQPNGIAVDDAGNVAIVGTVSQSCALPVPLTAWQSSKGGGPGPDAFLAVFTPIGGLKWATFFGGDQLDQGNGVTFDDAGNVYILGATGGGNTFLKLNAYQLTHGGGIDAFVAKFDATGFPVWSTYYGGSGTDEGHEIVIDGNQDVLITGRTSSINFPVSAGANSGNFDAFIVKLNNAGNTRHWARYFGGSSDEYSFGIDVDALNNVVTTGWSQSTTLPGTAGTFQTNFAGGPGYDGFVAKHTSAGILDWASFYGSVDDDRPASVKVDPLNGQIFITGNTKSTGLNIGTTPYQAAYGGGGNEAFLASFTNVGQLACASYFGGSSVDESYGVALSGNKVVIAGRTVSINLPGTSGGFQSAYGGVSDMFLGYFNTSCDSVDYLEYPGDTLICDEDSISINVRGPADSFLWSNGRTSDFIKVKPPLSATEAYTVTVTYQGCEKVLSMSVTACVSVPLNLLSFNAQQLDGGSVKLNWQTVNESNFDFFSIEKKDDFGNWREIGIVKGLGHSSTPYTYNYIDDQETNQQSKKIIYYRLKQFDTKGSYTYSNVISLKVSLSGNAYLQRIYPNPVKNDLFLKINTSESLNAEIQILNLLGEGFLIQRYDLEQGINSLMIQNEKISGLNPGLYFIKIEYQGSNEVSSFEYLKFLKE